MRGRHTGSQNDRSAQPSSSSSRYLFQCAVNNIFIMIMYRNKVQLLTQPQWAYYTPQLGTARSNNTKIITVMTCCKLNLHLAHFACAALDCYWLWPASK